VCGRRKGNKTACCHCAKRKLFPLGRVVLTSREHVIALEARDKGLMGMLLRYPYEVRDSAEYFDEIQDVKITKDMLDLAKHIVEQKSAHFDPSKLASA
jgi:DNA end-binding protein Ku